MINATWSDKVYYPERNCYIIIIYFLKHNPNAMSAEEKEPYTLRAKQSKGTDVGDGRNKFTSLGVSYATIDAEARELEEANNIMMQTIKNTVKSLNRKTTLLTHKFYLCHVNYFYKENDFYSAAEIALSEFNLKDGIRDTIHFFIDPGKIPIGFRYEAKDWAEKTHCIPFDAGLGEIQYYKMYIKIRDFLMKDGKTTLPPIYTMPDSLNSNMCLSAVKSALATLCEASNENNQFRVYPFPPLFYEIRNKCAETDDGIFVSALMPSVAIVENEIEKDVFSYAKDLGCSFHEERDRSIHCSLSIVTRWVYIICDHCCKHLGVTLELGKHCPKDADVNWDYKSTRFQEPERAIAFIDVKETNKDKKSFMPTIIDHGKLREIREQQYKEDTESVLRGEAIRPPRSFVSHGVKMADRLSADLEQLNLERVGEASGNNFNPLRNQPLNKLPSGRGSRVPFPNTRYNVGVQNTNQEEIAWPISGRGRLLQ